jgi:PAS domain S-box-containing protein
LNKAVPTFDEGQLAVLEGIATGAPLPELLEQIVSLVERQAEGMLCSILLLDPDNALHHGAAPSLPRSFVEAIDGSAIGPTEGSCGAAAFANRRVIISDIASHPNWEKYRHLALPIGLRASWSTPIVSPQNEVLGTFAMYFREPREPNEKEIAWVDLATHLAAIAIGHQRVERELRRTESRARELARLHAAASAINKMIARSRDLQSLNELACRVAVDYGLGRLVWVGRFVRETNVVEIIAQHGDVPELHIPYFDLNDTRNEGSLMHRAITTAEPAVWGNVTRSAPLHWQHVLAVRGLHSAAVFPLKDENDVVGVLALVTDKTDFYRDEELEVITALAADLSVVIETQRKEAERRRMEKAVRASEELRALVFDAVPHAMFYLHVDAIDNYRFVAVNRAFKTMFETAERKVLGRALHELFNEAAWLLIAKHYRTAMETGEQVTWEEKWNDDGQVRCHEVTIAPIRDAAGRCTDFVGTAHDTTQRTNAEAERARLVTQLNQAQRMQALGTLAGGIAHDFNNILAAISGNSAMLLQENGLTPYQKTHVREIEKASLRAIALVRQILTFSRHAPPKREILDPTEVTSEALNMLRATLPQTITLETEITADAPRIRGDPTQFHQILMNLGTNAAHAMPPRGGMIRFRLDCFELDTSTPSLPSLAVGRYLRLRVEDNGCGMDERIAKRAFDPFFTTRQPGEGTGLGLSVVHGIVESHRGAVELRSEVGNGTVVTVYLPASTSRLEGKPATRLLLGHGERVMYVDDEEALVFLIDRALTKMGYRVSGFPDSTVALSVFRSRPNDFDVVITDLSMPRLSGPDLAVELRRIRADVPIIMTSGFVRPEDVRNAERLGINQVVYKASTIDELGAALAREIAKLGARHTIANNDTTP